MFARLARHSRTFIARRASRRALHTPIVPSWNIFPMPLGHDASEKKVCVIYTGGTVGMLQASLEDGSTSLAPSKGYLTEKLEQTLMTLPGMPQCDIIEWDELLDSSNIEPDDWKFLAKQIQENYYDYDGFVVLHGTDTMAYTTSALSFMFKNLGKPVILTGSMTPLGYPHNDATRNVALSVITAGMSEIPEVMLFFDSQLIRGNRATKHASDRPNAFISPNFPRLGTVRHHMEIRTDLVLSHPKGAFQVSTNVDNSISIISLAPGFDDRMIIEYAERCADSERPSALVLMLYGTGGSPSKKAVLYDAVRRATDNGAIIVCRSQCMFGSIDFGLYAVSNQWIDSGAIAAADMTLEAITGKLSYLLGRGDLTTEQIKLAFQTSLRGERTDLINNSQPYLHYM